MPQIPSSYSCPVLVRNAHLATIIPNRFRSISRVLYQRQRLELVDGDFVDLDYSKIGSKSIALILHGLEGNSARVYAKALVKQANSIGMDACVFNQRSCSGEINRLFSSYHSGKSEDLRAVLQFLTKEERYDSIFLIGVSLGGNIVLKYCGEEGANIHSSIKAAVTISVPTDLEDSAHQLAKFSNSIYMRRFLKSLTQKTLLKMEAFPDCGISREAILKCKNFIDFDNLYTAPAHGFLNAADYWEKNSSNPFIPHIKIPTLLLTAQNDPFLGEKCYPIKQAKKHEYLFLELTKYGGHVGFVDNWPLSHNQYLERRPFEFFKQLFW